MKKLSIIAAAALVVMTACNNKSVDQKLQEFEDEVMAMTEKAEKEFSAITDEAGQDAFMEKYYEKIIAYHRQVIKKNKDNRVGLEAFRNVCNLLEPEEAEAIIASLNDSLKTDPFIERFSAQLEMMKSTAVGQKFTDFEVDGVKFSDYVGKGKYILVDFWASWCGPCKAEIPNIKNVYEKYHGDDFDVLSVAVWDEPEATKAAAEEHGIVWNQIVNAQRIPTDIYGISGIPTIMLFSPDGTILNRTMRGEEIEKVVAEALGR